MKNESAFRTTAWDVASAFGRIGGLSAPILCKHIAAVLYGVGARLDQKPELFFTLRRMALDDFVTRTALPRAPPPKEVLAADSLEGIFGIELDRAPRRRGR